MFELIATMVMTHITIVCVTVYLHRGQAHRGLVFHPALEHFFRFWLWLTTGMVTRQWVAIHRKHHVFSDRVEDPHSPVHYGIWRVLFGGAFLYHAESKNISTVEKYGIGTPADWIEQSVYSKHSRLGIILMLIIDVAVFGGWGFVIWAIQMLWIPFWAAGVINGLGHWVGYKNGLTRDNSRNLVPWGIVIGGEELHNNHHIEPASPKLSRRWFEFDIGWMWIKIFESVKLVTVHYK
jgi:stearoyl-CoA desaturase (Delta-9 desaturase)